MRLPATIGASRPAKFAVQFVNAIKMPANRGVISVFQKQKYGLNGVHENLDRVDFDEFRQLT